MRLTTSTLAPQISITAEAKVSPLYPLSAQTNSNALASQHSSDNAIIAPNRSEALASVTTTPISSPCVSTLNMAFATFN